MNEAGHIVKEKTERQTVSYEMLNDVILEEYSSDRRGLRDG